MSLNLGMLDSQLATQRRTVDFDTFDIAVLQLLTMLGDGDITIAPAYQRRFRWDAERSSKLIESLFLGVPIPSIFMATNANNSWDCVDGVQRLSTIVKFAGSIQLREKMGTGDALVLTGLTKLTDFNGAVFEDLPDNLQKHFRTRPIKVITLSDKSDLVVRYDLFERLNTGGIALSQQEIRDCIYQGSFANWLEERTAYPSFRKIVKLTPVQREDATAEECVLRFFAFRERYKQFEHSVKDFLNSYMKDASEKFDYETGLRTFQRTFDALAKVLPNGIKRNDTRNLTPLNFFEGIAVGASLALDNRLTLDDSDLTTWIEDPQLKAFTTGATNNRLAVTGRIEFCRDRFMGVPYVQRRQRRD